MPPKARGQGKRKAGREKAGDPLLLDGGRECAGPLLDDTIHEVAKRDKTADGAILGYARFDLIKYYDRLVFGEWNNRPLVDSQVQSLYQSFLVNGADRFNPIHAIPLVVPKKWLVEGSYSPDIDKRQELPVLEISGSVPKTWRIKAAGGHHRTKAIEAWINKVDKEYEAQLAEERRIAGLPADDVGRLQNEHIDKVVKIRLQKLAGILEYGGQWMVTVFDESQVDGIIGLHISQNETKHVYMQSPEEGLIQQYKILSATGKNWYNVEQTTAGGIFAKQKELLAQDYIFNHLAVIVSSGTHYIYSPEMQFNQFYNMMFSSYGGIIADVTMRLENRLRWCFNTISYDSRKGDAEMYQQLKQAHPVLAAISDPLREALNSVYEKHLGGCTAASYRLGNTNEDIWSKAYLQYKLDVIDVMEDYVRDKKETQAMNDLSDDVQKALEGCATKASLVLRQCNNVHDFVHFPLMSRSVITTLVRNLHMIERSIFEVSAWFSPLLYMAKAHGKDWTPGSASADMIRAIMCHSDYDPEQRVYAVTEIISLIFEMFPEFLNMEGQLTNINVPHRITKQRELQMLFGISDDGKERKCNTQRGKKKGKRSDDEDDADDENDDNPPSSDKDTDDELGRDESREGTDSSSHRKERLRKMDQARMVMLHAEAADAQKILNGGTKLTSVKHYNLYQPRSRESSISTDAVDQAFRGQHLISFHTYEWSATTSGSRARRMRILACIAILEQTVINTYRVDLLDDDRGGAVAIRLAIQDNTEKYRVARPTSRKKLSKLILGDSQPTLDHVNLTWPDQIHDLVVQQVDFDLEVELRSHKRDFLRVSQAHQAQNIIKLVQNSRIAWEDTTGAVESRDRPPLHPQVQAALEALIKVLSVNAYIQRQSPKLPFDSNFPSSEGLDVSYRAVDDEPVISHLTKHKKFVLLSRPEETVLLECKAIARQKCRAGSNGARSRGYDSHSVSAAIDLHHASPIHPPLTNDTCADVTRDTGLTRPPSTQAPTPHSALVLVVDPAPSSPLENQPVTTDLHVGPEYPPFSQLSQQSSPASITPGAPVRDIDPTPVRDIDPTPVQDIDPTPVLKLHPGPLPTQSPTTHVPASDDTCYGNNEHYIMPVELDGIGSAAGSDDELEDYLIALKDVPHAKQGKAAPRPRPIPRRGKDSKYTEGHRSSKEARNKREASLSLSSTDSYGGNRHINGKSNRKRRQLGEHNVGSSGAALSQLDEDILTQLA